MILVIGSVVALESHLDEALTLSQEHVRRSRGEPGCIAHDVHQDIENPQRLVFVEKWSDPAALRRHFDVPTSGAFVKAVAALAAEAPSMSIYRATEVAV